MNTSSKTITLTRTQKPFLGRDELLTMYYNDIRAYEPLTENETIELFKTYQNGSSSEKKAAKTKLFNHNTKLVVSMARKYCSVNDNLMDLIEEGNIGLLNAIDKFSLDKDSSFQKFALFHIRREINLYKINYTPMVQQTNRSKTDNIVKNIIDKFIQREQRNPTPDELLEIYNEENKEKLINNTADVINVEYVYIDNFNASDGTFMDSQSFIDFSGATSSFNEAIRTEQNDYNKEMIGVLMEDLTPKEKEAITLFYGIGSGTGYSLSMIATQMNCSSERARQLCASATNKMKKKSEVLSFSL